MKFDETHRLLHDMFNSRDFDSMDEHMRDDAPYTDQARGITTHSVAQFKDYLRGWTTAFSDARVTAASYVTGDGFSVCFFHGTGNNDGPIGTMSATGRTMDVPFCEALRFDAEGKVLGGELYYDQLSMLTQLGHIEQPARAAT